MKKPKEYEIDSFDQLLNVINKENAQPFIKDLAAFLLYYADVMDQYRKKYPRKAKGKLNADILKAKFLWIEDGKNDFVGVNLKNGDTGEVHKFNQK